MHPSEHPDETDLPPGAELPGHGNRRDPFGSPYAIPLTTLTAGAYVAVTDHVVEQPSRDGVGGAYSGGFTGPADDGD